MSIKLRLHYKYRYFLNILYGLAMPAWLDSAVAKVAVVVLVVVVGIGYIVETNTLSTSGYVINSLEKQVASAQSDIQNLQTEVAIEQSMSNIQKRLAEVKMVNAPRAKYISVDTAVAKN